jgi:2-keto-4-pentenoate hydratase
VANPERTVDVNIVADEVITSLTSHSQLTAFSTRPAGLTLADAYRVTSRLRSVFEARGERVVGRKIGFTNREMWKVHGVTAPIWGYATDRTSFELANTKVQFASNFAEPRIEPEIMFGLKTAPIPGMSETTLLDCIEWVSLGYEVVQSIYPNWKFAAPDTIAANGLHGALILGNRHPIGPRKAEWQRELATFKVGLYCDGKLSQNGGGALVLGSPLLALSHLVELLADDPQNPSLQAGEIISTGTLTLAMPVSPGESWTTKVYGIPFEEISLGFE